MDDQTLAFTIIEGPCLFGAPVCTCETEGTLTDQHGLRHKNERFQLVSWMPTTHRLGSVE